MQTRVWNCRMPPSTVVANMLEEMDTKKEITYCISRMALKIKPWQTKTMLLFFCHEYNMSCDYWWAPYPQTNYIMNCPLWSFFCLEYVLHQHQKDQQLMNLTKMLFCYCCFWSFIFHLPFFFGSIIGYSYSLLHL